MVGFKFPFQDKAVKFTHVSINKAEPLRHFRRQPADTVKLWGAHFPEQPALKSSTDPREHIPNTLVIHLVS